jgi:calmodulin
MVDNLTREQVEEFKEAFSLFDEEGNGQLSNKLLITVLRALGNNPTEEEVDFMIKEVDEDGSGTIEFDEFLQMMANKMNSINYEKVIWEAFKVYDRDGNGLISGAELRYVLSTQGPMLTQEEVDDIISEADMDGDGHINYYEFMRLLNV